METDQIGRLRDILDACRLVARYVDGVSRHDFSQSIEKQDAVIRRIEIIGEATSHLIESTREVLPQFPFRQMRGMRNIMAHEYANIDLAICGMSPQFTCQPSNPFLKIFSRIPFETFTSFTFAWPQRDKPASFPSSILQFSAFPNSKSTCLAGGPGVGGSSKIAEARADLPLISNHFIVRA